MRRRLSPGTLTVTGVLVAAVVGGCLLAVRGLTRPDQPPHRCAPNENLVLPCARWWGTAVDQKSGTLRNAVTEAERRTGRTAGIVHSFHRWSDEFPTSSERSLARAGHPLFLNWQPTDRRGSRIAWRSIADGQQDDQIDAAAARLRSLDRPMFLSFAHEPEADVGRSGSVEDYVAAWRHVHDRFGRADVRNVRWVWTVMGLDQPVWLARYPKLWPGERYVDWVGWDPYNWGACREREWRSFAAMVHPFYDWLVAHVPADTPLMLAEYGTVEDPARPDRKAQWFGEAGSALDQFPRLRALVYFDLPHPPATCDWRSDTSARSLSAFRAFAADAAFGR